MHLAEHNIKVDVYTHIEPTKGKPDTYIFYLKMSFLDTGWYMNSYTGRISPKFPETGLWIQPPLRGVYKLQEFRDPNNNPFWVYVQNQARAAILDYARLKSIKLPGVSGSGGS